jgi:hypothetical protein
MTVEKVELGSACSEEDRLALEKIAKELSTYKGRSKCKVANAHAMYQHGDHWKCSWCGHIIKIPLRDVIGDLDGIRTCYGHHDELKSPGPEDCLKCPAQSSCIKLSVLCEGASQ